MQRVATINPATRKATTSTGKAPEAISAIRTRNSVEAIQARSWRNGP